MSSDRIVAEIRDMPPEDVAARIDEARASPPAEIVERQKRERRERAELAAARWQR